MSQIKESNEALYRLIQRCSGNVEDLLAEVKKEVYEQFSRESILDIIFMGKGEVFVFNVDHDYDDSTPIGSLLEIYKYNNHYICLSSKSAYVQYYYRSRMVGQGQEDVYELLADRNFCQVYSENIFSKKFIKYRSYIPNLQDKIEFYKKIGQDPKVEILDEIEEYLI